MDEQMLLGTLGNTKGTAALLEGWAASRTTVPDGPLFFLEPPYLATAAYEAGLDPELAQALTSAARRIAADPTARTLAWHVYYRLFRAPSFDRRRVPSWPVPTAILGEDAGLLYPLALLGGLPEMRALYRAHGIPDAVARDTLWDLQRWADHYRRRHGVWGIAPSEVPWFRHHPRGELFDLGRLQFEPGPWTLEARVFRHGGSGAVTALSEGGIRYRSDGQRADPDDPRDAESWTARLELGEAWVIGHRIVPEGSVQRAEARLARAEWAEVLRPGDPVLYLHIPRGAPLDLEACRRSLARALEFFPMHFPERPFVAFACESWLLDAQLADLLSASSNIVRFQRQVYLVPLIGDQADALDWVFDGAYGNLARAPRDTTLRRAVLDHLRRGGRLRGGGCFLLFADLPAWGTAV
ncbi:MAG: acyltransferase domain-containing protein, partial [Chloroflexota bacterium]